MLNLANKRYIEKVTVSLNMIKISPTFICISAMEKGYLGKSFIMPVCWGFFFHFINFFFILLSSGHVESRSGDTMIGRDLWLWRAIRLSCLYSSLSKPFVKVRSFLGIICHPPPPQIPTFPPQILPSFAPLLILFCSHLVLFMVYSLFSIIRLFILNRKKYIKCNVVRGSLKLDWT